LKAKFESVSSYFSLKRIVRGGFNMGFTGSTYTALPGVGEVGDGGEVGAHPDVAGW
jgi:hypothetical protein